MPTFKPPLPTRNLRSARRLRQDLTDAERKLWQCLRNRQLEGLKFRRQHPVPPYIVDFVCLSKRLVIELDGSQHTHEVDASRTRYLQSQGIHVLRFWSNEVLTNPEAVVEAIWNNAAQRTLTPTPLPVGEGL